MQRTPVIVALLRTEEAGALAQFLKRAVFEDFQRIAVDLDEALCMQDAFQVLRAELARAGYPPHEPAARCVSPRVKVRTKRISPMPTREFAEVQTKQAGPT